MDTDLRRIVALLAANDPAAAVEVRNLGHRLLALADRLEAGQNPTKSVGGTGDRAQINVVGPDGEVKQSADTWEDRP
jgi:plasmid stabilization system protein ParE